MRLVVSIMLGCWLAAAPLLAFQASIVITTEEPVEVFTPGMAVPVIGPQPAGGPGAAPGAAAAGSPRMQRLQQLTFSRSPSAYLKAVEEEAREAKAAERKAAEPNAVKEAGAVKESGEAKTTPMDSKAAPPAAMAKSADSTTAKPEVQSPADTASPKESKTSTDAKSPDDAASPTDTKSPASTDSPEKAASSTPMGKPGEKPSPESEAQAKAAAEAAAKAAKAAEALEKELKQFQRDVTLGRWSQVKTYLAGLSKEEREAGFKQLLASLAAGPPQSGRAPESNLFTLDDYFGLVAASPSKIEKEALTSLAAIAASCLVQQWVAKTLLARLESEVSRPEAEQLLTRRQCAQLLCLAGQAAQAAPFLPTTAEAVAANDGEALNLLCEHFVQRYQTEAKKAELDAAWQANQAALGLPAAAPGIAAGPDPAAAAPGLTAAEEIERTALAHAVLLLTSVPAEFSQAWLTLTFTDHPARGRTLLTIIGQEVASSMQSQSRNPHQRLALLKLQRAAVLAALAPAGDDLQAWIGSITPLTANWIREAAYSEQYDDSAAEDPGFQRDPYGNIFYTGSPGGSAYARADQEGRPYPIPLREILETRPIEAWLAATSPETRASVILMSGRMLLVAGKTQDAFPLIEAAAEAGFVEQAELLAKQFLEVWGRNHNPNSRHRYTNAYMFMYGFEQRADSIPLTRSKQERNLAELGQWVARFRKLPIGKIDHQALAEAFTSCHSAAEIYRLEILEQIFGPLEQMDPDALATILTSMRSNLAEQWRDERVQQQLKTNRRKKDVEAEVTRGYQLATAITKQAVAAFPNSWSLAALSAALEHDEVMFGRELAKDPKFAETRRAALAGFASAAAKYAATLPTLPLEKEETTAFEQWFYASLGASDLALLSDDHQAEMAEFAKIRTALAALPEAARKRHQDRFANLLFQRLSSVKPSIKFRYLKHGFEIVGDNPAAKEAKEVFDYYADLLHEVGLEAVIDGSNRVGHGEAFGVFVRFRHTQEIERESNGFARYLQNQTNMLFSWNYGRPQTDYRERFEDAARSALEEHFEIISITFETDKVRSRAAAEYGWRITPYAYLLVKPKGPEVDRLPPLRMDLDFLDTSGYCVLPVETAALPIDCRPEAGDPRPASKIEVTQILDERQAKDGRLVLEIRATAQGLVPRWEEILEPRWKGFTIAGVEDRAVAVSRFTPDASEIVVDSERSWLIQLTAKEQRIAPGTLFRFAAAKSPDISVAYQRYVDADLEPAEADFPLAAAYGKPSLGRYGWPAAGVVLVLVLIYLIARSFRRPPVRDQAHAIAMPATLTPFTVLGLLERVRSDRALDASHTAELEETIRSVERHYFAGEANGHVTLEAIATKWVDVASATAVKA